MDVAPVLSERLALVSLSPACLEAALAGREEQAGQLIGAALPPGWAREHARLLQLRLEQLRTDPEAQPWLLRAVLLRGEPPLFLGHFNFHGPPLVGVAEVGYTLQPDHRGRGYAAEATAAMLRWAREQHGVRRFRASIAPGNEPSLRLVRRLGFVQTGEQIDEEDGLELVFELVLPAAGQAGAAT